MKCEYNKEDKKYPYLAEEIIKEFLFMTKVKTGDVVSVHYHGKLTDGTTFDSSEGREPLSFTVGSGQVIPGFDNALIDMEVGDKKTVNIPSDQAYGPANPENVIEFPKANIPPDMQIEKGMQLQLFGQDGQAINVLVVEVKEDSVVLDANMPLAGKDLIFDIELVKIN